MADPVTWIALGTIAAGQVQQGREENKIARRQAALKRKEGLADLSESQQIAKQERRKAELAQSRATALAAASGSAMDSPNIVDTIADIDARGEYNALAALYSGGTSMKQKYSEAKSLEKSGRAAQRAGYIDAISTMASGTGGFG